jgi:hypothetical protein
MTEQALSLTPSSSDAATAHRIDAVTSRIVRDELASGRPDHVIRRRASLAFHSIH